MLEVKFVETTLPDKLCCILRQEKNRIVLPHKFWRSTRSNCCLLMAVLFNIAQLDASRFRSHSKTDRTNNTASSCSRLMLRLAGARQVVILARKHHDLRSHVIVLQRAEPLLACSIGTRKSLSEWQPERGRLHIGGQAQRRVFPILS